MQRPVEVDAKVDAEAEAGAGQRRAVEHALVRLLQREDGVSVAGVSPCGEEYCAERRLALARRRPGGRCEPEIGAL